MKGASHSRGPSWISGMFYHGFGIAFPGNFLSKNQLFLDVSGSIVRNWLYSDASQILIERRVPCLRVTTCALCIRQKIGSSVSVIVFWKHGLQDSSEPAPNFNCCASQQVCLRTTSSRENTVHTRNISEQHVGMLFKSHPKILRK